MSAEMPKYGVVGLGIMGTPIARNLMKLGHPVVVWNRSQDKCLPLVAEGATAAATPADVVRQCDITFAMLSDPSAAEAVALGPGGIVEAISSRKGYVDMSTGALAAPCYTTSRMERLYISTVS
jgi:3-hydroxyisobutyrate dehydrogenase-like beta-hydroxyacid dehydrogenase